MQFIHLSGCRENTLDHIIAMTEHLQSADDITTVQFCIECINRAWDEINRLEVRSARLLNSIENYDRAVSGITDEMIECSREYPIADIIGHHKKGNVLCIVHEEKHPSMSLKGNRARCFSCGYFGDSIDVYMKIHGVGFYRGCEGTAMSGCVAEMFTIVNQQGPRLLVKVGIQRRRSPGESLKIS